mmetsp:Transcript_21574/g.47352  ORF Transcript_21574/g.47352 Transcript_21574/m.47352 type:complete len:138 (-) Transcript_21574:260-673(-)
MIVSMAVVGPANSPLFIHTISPEEDPLNFHYIIHCALDVLDERLNTKSKTPGGNDPNLGLIYPTEDYRVYGYVTNTKVKFFIIVDEIETKMSDIREIFRRFHLAYVDAVSNPFHLQGHALASKSFEARVRSLAAIRL